MIRTFTPVALVTVMILFSSDVSNAAEMYERQELLVEPRVQSEKAGIAERGEVSIIERRGFWVKVKSGDVVGWTKLSNVKMKETVKWMAPIDILNDTGRLAAGNR